MVNRRKDREAAINNHQSGGVKRQGSMRKYLGPVKDPSQVKRNKSLKKAENVGFGMISDMIDVDKNNLEEIEEI